MAKVIVTPNCKAYVIQQKTGSVIDAEDIANIQSTTIKDITLFAGRGLDLTSPFRIRVKVPTGDTPTMPSTGDIAVVSQCTKAPAHLKGRWEIEYVVTDGANQLPSLLCYVKREVFSPNSNYVS